MQGEIPSFSVQGTGSWMLYEHMGAETEMSREARHLAPRSNAQSYANYATKIIKTMI